MIKATIPERLEQWPFLISVIVARIAIRTEQIEQFVLQEAIPSAILRSLHHAPVPITHL